MHLNYNREMMRSSQVGTDSLVIGFQAVVLAAGRGPYLSVGALPVLCYSLHLLEIIGFQETLMVVPGEDNSNIVNALERCPLNIKYDLINIPADDDWSTVDTLNHISNRVVTDLLVIPGDLITNINLNEVLNLYRKHDAAFTALYFNNGPEESIELPDTNTKSKPERDLVFIEKETQRLVFVASASNSEDNVTLPKLIIKTFHSISMYSGLLDAHVYVMKHWLVNYLVEANKLISLKGELLPHIVKRQLSKPKDSSGKKGVFEEKLHISKDLFDYVVKHGYESQIRDMSHYNDHEFDSKDVYYNDIFRSYAYIAEKNTYGIRVNTLPASYLSDSKDFSKWEDLIGSPLTERFNPTNVVKTTQIDETSIVGYNSAVSDRAYLENSVIGANCIIAADVILTNCVLYDNVVVREGSVLRDTVLHTRVTVEPHCTLQNSVVNAGARIGRGCKLNDCVVNPNVNVAPGTTANNQVFN